MEETEELRRQVAELRSRLATMHEILRLELIAARAQGEVIGHLLAALPSGIERPSVPASQTQAGPLVLPERRPGRRLSRSGAARRQAILAELQAGDGLMTVSEIAEGVGPGPSIRPHLVALEKSGLLERTIVLKTHYWGLAKAGRKP